MLKDITFCTNSKCKIRNICERFITGNKGYKWVQTFQPDIKTGKCKFFICKELK